MKRSISDIFSLAHKNCQETAGYIDFSFLELI